MKKSIGFLKANLFASAYSFAAAPALVVALAVIAAVVFSGCKQEEDPPPPPQKKLVITGITEYDTLDANIKLFMATNPTKTLAEAEATVKGGTLTFALKNPDGTPFTGGGLIPYTGLLTILDASGTNVGAYIGTCLTIWIKSGQEITTIEFTAFTGQGTGGV